VIREATIDDVPRLIELGRCFHAASPYNAMEYDASRVKQTLESVLESGIVVVSGNPVDGMAAAIKAPMWFTDGLAAQELFLWGSQGKGLRMALEAWASAEGCETFSMVCLENERTPTLVRMYRMAGYHPTERHFVKAL